MGRPKSTRVNVEALKKLYESMGGPLNLTNIFVYIMIESGATYQDVADVIGAPTRQRAEYYYRQISEALSE